MEAELSGLSCKSDVNISGIYVFQVSNLNDESTTIFIMKNILLRPKKTNIMLNLCSQCLRNKETIIKKSLNYFSPYG